MTHYTTSVLPLPRAERRKQAHEEHSSVPLPLRPGLELPEEWWGRTAHKQQLNGSHRAEATGELGLLDSCRTSTGLARLQVSHLLWLRLPCKPVGQNQPHAHSPLLPSPLPSSFQGALKVWEMPWLLHVPAQLTHRLQAAPSSP